MSLCAADAVGRLARPGAIGLAVLTVAAFVPVKLLLIAGERAPPEFRLSALMLLLLVALATLHLRARLLPGPVLLVYRGILLLFAVYMAAAQVPILPQDLALGHLIESRVYGWAMPVLGIAALWRISLAVPVLIAAKWHKFMMSDVLGIYVSPTDYSPVLEFGLTLALGGLVCAAGRTAAGWWRESEPAWDGAPTPLETVLLTAVAVHFSNYFYSAVQKMVIGDHWWQWVSENPTQNLILAAWEVGALPLRLLGDDFAASVYEWFAFGVVPLNASILLLQAAAVVAILRIRWAAAVTALYDVSHIAIFLTSGIFFYKWIWLNLLIVIALAQIDARRIPAAMGVWLVLVILAAPGLYFVTLLGWFDSTSLNHERIEAIDDRGRAYTVPTNYFLAGSITHAQQGVLRNKTGHFQNYAYGAVLQRNLDDGVFEAAQRCELPVAEKSAAITPPVAGGLSRLLQKHHAYVLSLVDDNGGFEYDLFPHHIFSMPTDFDRFRRLDKRRIVAYRYIIESKCLGWQNGRPASRIVLRGDLLVPVEQNGGMPTGADRPL